MADMYAEIPELSAESAAIARRRKIAEALMARSQDPVQGYQMAGQIVVPMHWSQGAAKLLEGYAGGVERRKLDEQEKELSKRYRGMRDEAIDKVRNAMLPTEQTEQLPPDVFGPPQTKMVAPSIEQKRQAIIEAQLSPFAQVQRFGAAQQKFDEMDQAREARANEIRMKLEDQRISREERAELQRELQQNRLDAQREMRTLAASMRQPPAPVVTEIVRDGKRVKVDARTGNVIGESAPTPSMVKLEDAKKRLQSDMTMTIKELEAAAKDGGLIDQSTGSGAGALRDTVAGFFGKSTSGADAVAKMRPIYDMALKMVPRFEGPQSDKDTLSYKEASGKLADPATPNPQKKAAAREIVRLMKQRQGQFVSADMEAAVGTQSANEGGWTDL